MKLVNLMQHSITLRGLDGADTVIESSGFAYIEMPPTGEPETIDGVPVPIYGLNMPRIVGVPNPTSVTTGEGSLYIVTEVVAASLRNQTLTHDSAFLRGSRLQPSLRGTFRDIVYPGTGPEDGAIRNERGQVVLVTRLIRA